VVVLLSESVAAAPLGVFAEIVGGELGGLAEELAVLFRRMRVSSGRRFSGGGWGWGGGGGYEGARLES